MLFAFTSHLGLIMLFMTKAVSSIAKFFLRLTQFLSWISIYLFYFCFKSLGLQLIIYLHLFNYFWVEHSFIDCDAMMYGVLFFLGLFIFDLEVILDGVFLFFTCTIYAGQGLECVLWDRIRKFLDGILENDQICRGWLYFLVTITHFQYKLVMILLEQHRTKVNIIQSITSSFIIILQ